MVTLCAFSEWAGSPSLSPLTVHRPSGWLSWTMLVGVHHGGCHGGEIGGAPPVAPVDSVAGGLAVVPLRPHRLPCDAGAGVPPFAGSSRDAACPVAAIRPGVLGSAGPPAIPERTGRGTRVAWLCSASTATALWPPPGDAHPGTALGWLASAPVPDDLGHLWSEPADNLRGRA